MPDSYNSLKNAQYYNDSWRDILLNHSFLYSAAVKRIHAVCVVRRNATSDRAFRQSLRSQEEGVSLCVTTQGKARETLFWDTKVVSK
jgi:hypothetical protein